MTELTNDNLDKKANAERDEEEPTQLEFLQAGIRDNETHARRYMQLSIGSLAVAIGLTGLTGYLAGRGINVTAETAGAAVDYGVFASTLRQSISHTRSVGFYRGKVTQQIIDAEKPSLATEGDTKID